MRLFQNFFPSSVIFLLLGFVISCGSRQSSSKATDADLQEPDTLVYSFPFDYGKNLAALADSSKLKIESYKDILELYETLNYTPEAWQAGIREVPRIYLTTIGERWGSQTTKEITVTNKKRLFFRGIAPLILRSNEWILKDRDRLEGIRSSLQSGDSIPEADQIWLGKLSKLYKIKVSGDQLSNTEIEELWTRVDVVPPSLAMAQGAEESGWGTSRFAAQGNAIYGQWTWGENAIVPEQQRKELGNYGIASFESLQESISGYMLNLNTHNAYSDLRSRRATLRENGEKITGMDLAETLTRYSERGEAYVETLKEMMEYNQLSPADDAYLSEMAAIYLIPADPPIAE